jgi:hypothetical protein
MARRKTITASVLPTSRCISGAAVCKAERKELGDTIGRAPRQSINSGRPTGLTVAEHRPVTGPADPHEVTARLHELLLLRFETG